MEFPDKEQFRTWLQKHPGEDVISENWGFCDCPLARWLNDAGVTERAYIQPRLPEEDAGEPYNGNRSFWSETPYGQERPMPEWAIKFGNAVDEWNFEVAVTAEACLAILDEQ